MIVPRTDSRANTAMLFADLTTVRWTVSPFHLSALANRASRVDSSLDTGQQRIGCEGAISGRNGVTHKKACSINQSHSIATPSLN